MKNIEICMRVEDALNQLGIGMKAKKKNRRRQGNEKDHVKNIIDKLNHELHQKRMST